MWIDPLAVFPLEHQVGTHAVERRQIFFANKLELDRAIESALRYGWKLLNRSYSSEKGHGADLVRLRMNKAA